MTLLTTTTPLLFHLNCISSQIRLLSVKDPSPTSKKLFSLFCFLLTTLNPPPPPSLTADEFATYFTKKIKDVSSSFTQRPCQSLRKSMSLLCFGTSRGWKAPLTNVRTAESLSIFLKRLKTHLFRLHLDLVKHDSPPTPPQKIRNICTCMFLSLALQ